MKKRIFACVLACLMILTALPVVAFAEGETMTCPGFANADEHTVYTCSSYTTVAVVEYDPEVPCAPGREVVKCDKCGATFEINIIPATADHEYAVTVPGVDATCTKDGKTAVEACVKCGVVKESTVIGKLGHDYQLVGNENLSCDGKNTYRCVRCPESYTVAVDPDGLHNWGTGNQDADWDGDGVIEPEDGDSHKAYFVKVSKEPTCAATGIAVYRCYDCEARGLIHEKEVIIEKIDCVVDELVHYDAVAPSYTKDADDYCTKGGNVEFWHCPTCRKNYADDQAITEINPYVAPVEHNWIVHVDQKVGYTQAGVWVGECSVCHEIKRTETPAGHDLKTVEVPATCIAGAYTFTYCTRSDCYMPEREEISDADGREYLVGLTNIAFQFGKNITLVYTDVNGDRQVNADDTIPVHFVSLETSNYEADRENGHVYGEYHEPPTCTEIGTHVKWCILCDYVDTREWFEAEGHDFTILRKDLGVPATCQHDGYDVYECEKTLCAELWYSEPYALEEPNFYGSVADAKTHHEGLDLATKRQERLPSCGVVGLDSYICTDCGIKVFVKNGDALKDVWNTVKPAKPATCTEDGWTEGKVCAICNKVDPSTPIASHGGHDIQMDEPVAATCTTTGLTKGWSCRNKNSDGTPCGYVEIAQMTTPTLGGHILKEVSPYIAPTCTKVGYEAVYECVRCNAEGEDICNYVSRRTPIPATGHSVPGLIDGNRNPTCERPAYMHWDCVYCDAVVDSRGNVVDVWTNYIPALGHDTYVNALETIEPTCGTDGLEVSYCITCGKRFEKVIPALGHYNAAGQLITGCVDPDVTDRVCVECDTKIPYTYDQVTYAEATCQHDGYELHYCTKCGAWEDRNHDGIKADHKYPAWDSTQPGLVKCVWCEHRYGVTFSADVENAVKSGSEITDSSLIAVTVKVDAANVPVMGLYFNLAYNENVFTFVPEMTTFVSAAFNTHARVNDNHNQIGSYISAVAVTPNDDEGKMSNHVVNGEEALVVLYFRVNDIYGESRPTHFYNSTFDFSGTDATNDCFQGSVDGRPASIPTASIDETVTLHKLMDINCDGAVGLADLEIAISVITGEFNNGTEDYKSVVDVDKDGDVDYDDITAIRDYLIGAMSYEAVKALGVDA